MGSVTPAPPDRAFTSYARLIKELGFPIIVALILLYVVLADVPDNVQAIRDDVSAARRELGEHARITETYHISLKADLKGLDDRLARIMQQICVNTAPTPQDRRGCFP